MSSSFFKSFFPILGLPFILVILVSILFIPVLGTNYDLNSINFETNYSVNSNGFIWPVSGHKTITSYFGNRTAPTAGASTYHSGIDIAAPVGTNLIATISGKITYTGFNGAGGYTITLTNNEFSISYCHVSPIFLVSVGDYVKQGNVIGNVGPKNVYGVKNNPYKDSNGNPTNRCNNSDHIFTSL